jgi:hypothetical protein
VTEYGAVFFGSGDCPAERVMSLRKSFERSESFSSAVARSRHGAVRLEVVHRMMVSDGDCDFGRSNKQLRLALRFAVSRTFGWTVAATNHLSLLTFSDLRCP